jgi:hypothetical protein
VYVFSLLAIREQGAIEPLDVAQWKFFVVATCVLDDTRLQQQSISVSALKELCEPCEFADIADAVEVAARL